ncbi:MAG: TIM barrel protein [Acidimicrobiia bacterium]
MKLQLFKTLWGAVGAGSPHPTLQEAIPAVAADGFEGVAFALIAHQLEPGIGSLQQLRELCNEHGLGIATLVQTSGDTVKDHLKRLRSEFQETAPLKSRHLICHGGRDAFDDGQAVQFYSEALKMEDDLGLTVAHETHRSRILYNPWTTARMLERFENLKLALDLSHWVVVAERLIDDQLDIIRAAAALTIHIDDTDGYPQGPQVPDPREPEWAETLESHLRWWNMAWDEQEVTGLHTSTVVPEFGPPPYQQTLPYTGEPTADLWEVVGWMAKLLRDRFDARPDR